MNTQPSPYNYFIFFTTKVILEGFCFSYFPLFYLNLAWVSVFKPYAQEIDGLHFLISNKFIDIWNRVNQTQKTKTKKKHF